MTAIPHAALALTSALGRFEHASSQVLRAATGAGDEDLGDGLVEMAEAKVQARAGAAVIRFADEMYGALLDLARERR
ncbi:MAG: hypothetical protein R3C25_01090 [Hyphomonadaceae bacterium]